MLARNKTPRNNPCLCGSGKKHKHCCLESDNKINSEELKKFDTFANTMGQMKDMFNPVESKASASNKGLLNGSCNVTRCRSSEDVTYLNDWNNKYYCQTCAIRFTRSDEQYRDGFRISALIPHPLLLSQSEISNHPGNTKFCVPVELRDDGYYFEDWGKWHRVPDKKLRRVIAHGGPEGSFEELREPIRFFGKQREVMPSEPNADKGVKIDQTVVKLKNSEVPKLFTRYAFFDHRTSEFHEPTVVSETFKL